MGEPSYKKLKSYQQAEIISDFTCEFCKKYLDPKSRTNGQMEQAARSGKQNIVEGCAASAHNPKTEVFLLGVARASFQELLADYEDFLRQKGFQIWGKSDPRAMIVRQLPYRNRPDRSEMSYGRNKFDRPDNSYKSDRSDKTYTSHMTYKSYLENPEQAANAMITLINQTNYLLDQQIKTVKQQHEEKGVAFESHGQKLSRIMAEKEKKEKEFDNWLKEQVEKSKTK